MQKIHSGGRVLRALVAACVLTGALPALAADDVQTLPRVTVTGTRGASETPAEAGYADAVFRKLDKTAHYPTGREASQARPSGTATVWFELQRNGKLAGKGVEQSSGSQVLDQMALTLVSRQKYAALPADAWAGPKHRFVVRYQFDGNPPPAPARAKKS